MTVDSRLHPRADTDARVAAAVATAVSSCLLALRESVGEGDYDQAELRRAGDREAQRIVADRLHELRPADPVLSEEAVDDRRRLDADRVWIVDPLDGTREFAERDDDGTWRDDFAVHVALWQRGRGLTDGAVALPARRRIYATDDVPPVSRSRGDVAVLNAPPLRIAASRTRPPRIVRALAASGDAEVVSMGSCGAKSIAVLEGVADAYVHAEGQFEWDSAAPVAVVTAAGLVATRLDGSSLEYNRPDPRLPDLVVCHPDVAGRLRLLLDHAHLEGAPS